MGQDPDQKRDAARRERQEQQIHRKNERQERHARKKREAILDAASQVFAQKGFAASTTKDIANAADIGESTLYDYFDSKRDILLAIAFQHHAIFDDMFHETGVLPNREALIDLVSRSFDFAISRVQYTRMLLIESLTDDEILIHHVWPRIRHVYDLLQSFIAAQVEAKHMRPVDPALIARLTMGMFFASIAPVLRGLEPPPSPEKRRALAEAMVSLLMDGLSIRNEESV